MNLKKLKKTLKVLFLMELIPVINILIIIYPEVWFFRQFAALKGGKLSQKILKKIYIFKKVQLFF